MWVEAFGRTSESVALEKHINIFICDRNPLAKYGGVLPKIWTIRHVNSRFLLPFWSCFIFASMHRI